MTDLPIYTARIVDLPAGGFLVLDHVVSVGISPPFYAVMAVDLPSFRVWARTTHGAEIFLARFDAIPPENNGIGPARPETPEWAEAERQAVELVAQVREAIAR